MSSESLRLTPEEAEKYKEHLKWLDEHPFTKKWRETCPFPGKNPLYEKPRLAEIIKPEQGDMAPKKEIKIEKTVTPEEIEELCKKKRIGENTRKHGPLMAKFIEDAREAETEEIKEEVEKTMKEGMLSEADIRTLQKMWEDSRIPLNEFLTRFKECLHEHDMANYFYSPGIKIDWRNKIDDKEMLERTKKFLDIIYGKHEAQCKCKCQNEDNKSKLPKETLEAFDSPIKEEYVTPSCESIDLPGQDIDLSNYISNINPNSFRGIAEKIIDLHERKNNDYGNAAHESYEEFGIISYVIRLNDKLNRLKSLTKPGAEQQVKEESIVDTLMDLAAYSIMAIESLKADE